MSSCAVAYSGRGRLARAVAAYFSERGVRVIGIVDRPSARKEALVELGLPVYSLANTAEAWLSLCRQEGVRFIALAGYLVPVPAEVVKPYAGRIFNSHPALLPAFGGKGMYGRRVHAAVVAAGALESGFTVHEVTDRYDEGPIVYQVRLPIFGLSVEAVEAFIQAVERELYPAVLWRLWQQRVEGR